MKKMLKYFFALALVLFLAACGNGESSEGSGSTDSSGGQVVNWVAPQEIATLDNAKVNDINSSNFVGHIQEGLYWEDENNETHPALAEDMPEVSEDGLTYTITMREDATWSNGEPITANDFVYAVQRLVDPETAATYAYLAEPIGNAPEIMAGEMSPEEIGVTAVDDYTIEIQLTQPTPHMINLLAFSPFYPTNQAFVEEQGTGYGTTSDALISSGPYVIEDWDGASQTWTLQKNEDYYNAEEIAIDTINVQVIKEVTTNVNLYEAGQADNAILQGELAKQYAEHPDLVQRITAGTYYLYINHENENLQNANLRAAIDYAVDNQELVDNVLGDGSETLASFMPADFIFNPDTGADFVEDSGVTGRYDEAQAAELWEQAKEELGTEEITLNLLASDSEGTKTVTEYIQGQIQSVLPGVSVQIQNVPTKNRISQAQAGEFDLLLSGWIADYADGLNFLQLMVSDSSYNDGNYNNAEYDAQYEAAETENADDPTARWENMQNAHQILMDEAAFVPLYQSSNTQLINPRIQGLTLRSVGNEFDFRTAYIEE